MLLMMLEKGMPVDDILFCDTGLEFPGLYTHLDEVEQYIGRPIARIQAPHSFEYYFCQHPIRRKRTCSMRSASRSVGRNSSWNRLPNE